VDPTPVGWRLREALWSKTTSATKLRVPDRAQGTPGRGRAELVARFRINTQLVLHANRREPVVRTRRPAQFTAWGGRRLGLTDGDRIQKLSVVLADASSRQFRPRPTSWRAGRDQLRSAGLLPLELTSYAVRARDARHIEDRVLRGVLRLPLPFGDAIPECRVFRETL
jgi:hypothetical protein